VLDGPFAETKELVAGYSILEVSSMAEAIEWVKRSPNPTSGGEWEAEIRPIMEADDFGDALIPELRAAMARRKATAAEQHR
jgi:hypothetical protein